MARFFEESEVEPVLIVDRRVAVIGYGSQGSAQALNLRDSGAKVVVGLRPDSPRIQTAGAAGLDVMPIHEAIEGADYIVLTVPDAAMPAVFEEHIHGRLWDHQVLVFAHGYNIHYGRIHPPENVDVVLVAPKGPGPALRSEFVSGRGLVAVIAVHQDASGRAMDRAVAYAHGIGSLRVGAYLATFREETETDLFSEQAVLCGGIPELVKAGFETLVAAGYQPESAYIECLHETKAIVDLMVARGLTGMRESISSTAEWGGYVAGKKIVDDGVRHRMQEVLAAVQNGSFAAEWNAEADAGMSELVSHRSKDASSEIESVGEAMRRRIFGHTRKHP
ncbi:MAG: Ketol-acid reductoisomerase (NADP(+)) [Fimbriimonadaceae bacterium]|nr:Ketol-acid reductoisomerase (NADP(+)) [Fimbriimonadaceae bacterium]